MIVSISISTRMSFSIHSTGSTYIVTKSTIFTKLYISSLKCRHSVVFFELPKYWEKIVISGVEKEKIPFIYL